MDLLKEIINSGMQTGVRQSPVIKDMEPKATPIREARMYGFAEGNHRFWDADWGPVISGNQGRGA